MYQIMPKGKKALTLCTIFYTKLACYKKKKKYIKTKDPKNNKYTL